jgi:hypothetical protein
MEQKLKSGTAKLARGERRVRALLTTVNMESLPDEDPAAGRTARQTPARLRRPLCSSWCVHGLATFEVMYPCMCLCSYLLKWFGMKEVVVEWLGHVNRIGA